MSAELWGILGIFVAILAQTGLGFKWAGKWQERLERLTLDVGDLRRWKHGEVTGFMQSTQLRLGLLEQDNDTPFREVKP